MKDSTAERLKALRRATGKQTWAILGEALAAYEPAEIATPQEPKSLRNVPRRLRNIDKAD